MEQAFDPYYRWLAIPPEEQPPNYYRLLGVKLFETDVEVISTAADRQMAHIRTYQVGQHAAESQKLLNEIATARIWLLNPGKRSAYDQSLHAKLKPTAPPRPPRAQPLRAIPMAVPAAPIAAPAPSPATAQGEAVAQGEFDALADIADSPRTSHHRPISNKRSPLGPLVAIGTICLAIVLGAVYLKTRHNDAAPEQAVGNPPLDDAPEATTTDEPKSAEKKTKSTKSAETKTNGDPVSEDGDTGEGSEQLLAARKALAERNVAEARLQLRQAEKKRLGNDERLAVTRLRAIAGLLDDFWTAVRSAIGRLQRNDEIIFDGEPLAVVIDVNPKQLTLRWAGRNRTFAPEALPANIALALAEMQLRNKPAGNAALGAFLAMDSDGDRKRARDLWLMAAQKGQKTKTLMAELDVPLAIDKPDNSVAKVDPDEDSMPADRDDSSPAVSHEEPAVERVPAPSAEAIQSAVKVVRQVYKQDFAQAKRVTDKESLADKLLSDAASSQDPSERYALFSEARALAMSAASVPRVVEAVEGIGKYFEIDALDLAADALERLNDRDLQVLTRKELAEAAAPMFDRAVTAGKFDTAQRLGTVAVTAARKAGERELAKKLAPKNNELAALRRQVDAGLAALKTLEEMPDDEAANLAAGKYLCLIKEDWERGLPRLAKGSDSGLKQLAANDLDPPTSPENQARLGDGWWDLAEKDKGKSKEALQRRAGFWYQQAVEKLTGLSKAKVEKRLAEIPADTADAKPKPKAARDATSSKKLPPGPPAVDESAVGVFPTRSSDRHGEKLIGR